MPADSTDILHSGVLDNLKNYRIFRRRYPRRELLPTKSISEWYLQETQLPGKSRGMWICLVGLCDGARIRTLPVASVISPRKVCTSSCIYLLGQSTRVLEHPVRGLEVLFADGFPSDWESLVEQAFSGLAWRRACVDKYDGFSENLANNAAKTPAISDALGSSAGSGHIDLSYNGDVDDSISALLNLTSAKSVHAASANGASPHAKCVLPLASIERNGQPHLDNRQDSPGKGMAAVASSEDVLMKSPLASDFSCPGRSSPLDTPRKKLVVRVPPRPRLPINTQTQQRASCFGASSLAPAGTSPLLGSTADPKNVPSEEVSMPSKTLSGNRTLPTTASNRNRKRKLRLVMPKRPKMLSKRKY